MLLKLTYSRASDQHQTVTVLGDPDGIRDLYWQLTHNYKPIDGTAIGNIEVRNLDGDVAAKVMEDPCRYATNLSYLDR